MLSLAGPSRQVVAFDLPGHGESAPLPGNPQDVASLTQAALTTLDALGITACDVYAHQGGSAVAVEIALLAPGRVRRLVLDAPPCITPDRQDSMVEAWFAGLQSFAPRWDGGHLVQAWHMRRDMALWWPWFERRRATARANAPAIDPVALTAELREAMKQPHSHGPALRAVLGYPMAARLTALPLAPLLVAREDDAWGPCLDEAARARPDARVTRISSGDDLAAWLRGALGGAPR
jgi:pimeloyl-ACP methyl ester carboxylesterase